MTSRMSSSSVTSCDGSTGGVVGPGGAFSVVVCVSCVGDSGVASDAVEVLGCADSDVASEPETSRGARDVEGVGVL